MICCVATYTLENAPQHDDVLWRCFLLGLPYKHFQNIDTKKGTRIIILDIHISYFHFQLVQSPICKGNMESLEL